MVFDRAEERIGELKERSMEIIQTETKREKNKTTTKESIQELMDNRDKRIRN